MNTPNMFQPIGIVGLIITNTLILVMVVGLIGFAIMVDLGLIRDVLLGVQLVAVHHLAAQ